MVAEIEWRDQRGENRHRDQQDLQNVEEEAHDENRDNRHDKDAHGVELGGGDQGVENLLTAKGAKDIGEAGRANNQNVVAATAYIVPLGLFFPLQSTADFFGQWNNIFLWSAVALSMAAINLRAERGSS